MKKIYFLSLTLLMSIFSFGQATDLYFGMYSEGSSNNKFIQIYNGTNLAVDLSNYSVELYANGAVTATNTQTFTAGTMLAAGDVYVLYNSSSNAAIIAAGDASSSACNFNGDDAIALKKLGTVIDVIGSIGVDPGTAWAVGSTADGTLNHTIIRKLNVCNPNPVNLSSFGTDDATSEWTVYAIDAEWGQIGTHVGCSTTPSLSVSSPANNLTFSPETNSMSISLVVNNFTVANGTGNGHIHYTVNGGSVVMKYDTTPISLTSLTPGVYTVYLELVDNSHVAVVPAVNTSVTFTIASYNVVADLAALRADVIANGANKYYQVSSSPVITYARATRNQKYVQDASAAILIDDLPGTIATAMVAGDAVSGLKGQASLFSGVLQFLPSTNATIASSGNTVTPQVVTAADITANIETYESELVQINNSTFTTADGIITFTANTNYNLNDGSDIAFRSLFAEANYIGQIVPTGAANRGVLVAEFNGVAQVVSRSTADVLSSSSFSQIDGLKMYPNPTKNNLFIETALNGDINVSIVNMLGKEVVNANVVNNTVNVSNLTSGIYIVKITEEGKTSTKKLIIE
ncbi:T9SS type A sorting domain-containing protein [Flavobacterium terrigena]|uniref:Por secretion system C-terminal sorting domain-containing protein n=1 Tax=Flavobacterium terrigena TaxID=402734 RepID=A0A1H6VBF2_9FLAO|nr:T9SS type A sorting domain-containing protein [Flavobacterium terrigena]SEJ01868.1 Por secretion system C-terminal sorting domain-containing protein [Flavobacterium terrigena]